MMMEQNQPAGNDPPENGDSSPLREWLAVGSVTIGAFAFVTTEFLPVGLLPQIARDLGVTPTAGLMVTKGKRIGIISGGNVDPERLCSLVAT
jgi:hypothetical protein